MFKLSIFDQERKLYEATASEVRLPGETGELGVLDFHAPMLTLLRAGGLVVDGKLLPIRRGVALVDANTVFVLVER